MVCTYAPLTVCLPSTIPDPKRLTINKITCAHRHTHIDTHTHTDANEFLFRLDYNCVFYALYYFPFQLSVFPILLFSIFYFRLPLSICQCVRQQWRSIFCYLLFSAFIVCGALHYSVSCLLFVFCCNLCILFCIWPHTTYD